MIATFRCRLSWIVTILATACVSCTEVGGPSGEDSPTEETAGVPLQGLIVSEPRVSLAGSAANSVAAGVTYVSMQPGTVPLASSVRIRNRTTGAPATTPIPVIDGGFDPVAIPASAGDLLEFTFVQTTGAAVVFSARVPPRRPPSVVRIHPAKGRTDVALSTRPAIIFSEPVDPRSLTTTSLQLLRGVTPVVGTVAIETGSPWTAEFTPASLLQPTSNYELVITQDVRDLDGDALVAPARSTFTTTSSPTGTTALGPIAFVSNRYGRANIFVVNADGSGVTQVTYGDRDVAPSWSPDGRRIVYARRDGIHVIDADGSNSTMLTSQWGDSDPAWSPDGAKIAFTRIVAWNDSTEFYTTALHVMNQDGSGVRRLTEGVRPPPLDQWPSDSDPSWSPDGRRIAFNTGFIADSTLQPATGVINADGTGLERIRPPSLDVECGATWSPDGRLIAMLTYQLGIVTVSSDGSTQRTVYPGATIQHPTYRESDLWCNSSLDWSPDGQSLVFVRELRSDPKEVRISIVDLGSGIPRQLVPNAIGGQDFEPAWARVRDR
jgi:Tol biopolymer transport system component